MQVNKLVLTIIQNHADSLLFFVVQRGYNHALVKLKLIN